MGQKLEELVVNEEGVFLKSEQGGQPVAVTPVSFIAEVRVDGLGQPCHKQPVVDHLFRYHPDEIRGFIAGPVHDHKAAIQYYACRVIAGVDSYAQQQGR